MDNIKYVVGIHRDTSRRYGPEGRFHQEILAVIFDKNLPHSEMEMVFMDVLSAGFVVIGPTSVSCYGRSESLDVESIADVDNYFVSKALNIAGYQRNDNREPPITVEAAFEIIRTRKEKKRGDSGINTNAPSNPAARRRMGQRNPISRY